MAAPSATAQASLVVKEVLTRFEGVVVEGEGEPVAVDVRKDQAKEDGRVKKFTSKCLRGEFVEVKYEVRLVVLLVLRLGLTFLSLFFLCFVLFVTSLVGWWVMGE